jgi:hypothetical protein
VSQAQIDQIKQVGTVIVTGAVPQDVGSNNFIPSLPSLINHFWYRKLLGGNNRSRIMLPPMLVASKVLKALYVL